MGNVIKVGMADLKVAHNKDFLMTAGLGSCIGICLYDLGVRVGGMAHIMLPSSAQARSAENQAKFADTAVPLLIEEMLRLGAVKTRIRAKIAGGAQMFSFPGTQDVLRIGQRNAEAAKVALESLKIPLLAQDTGGNYGRTIQLCTVTGDLLIKTIQHGEKVL